jgi:hypothetical protein
VVLAALRLDAGRLPVPRADGDREALRILLVARQEMTEACTAQAGRLRALLLAGDDGDRRAARATLPGKALAGMAGREIPAQAGREQAVRQAEIGRLALALSQARRQLKDNRAQLLAIVEDIAPGLTSRYGVGPVSAAPAIVSFSHPGRCRSEAAYAALGGTSPLPASSEAFFEGHEHVFRVLGGVRPGTSVTFTRQAGIFCVVLRRPCPGAGRTALAGLVFW